MSILKSKISNLALLPTLTSGIVVIAALVLSACSSSSDPQIEPPGTGITECEQTNTCEEEMEQEMEEQEVVELPPIIKPLIPADQREPLAFDSSFVYQSGSPYRDVLQDCYSADLKNACDLDTLPFLGMSEFDPSVNSIMARTVVTHNWAGLRFSQFLARLPAETLNFFKPVTVIYIGSDIVFNSFDSTQGKLEIAADNLWLTFGEKSTAFFPFVPSEDDPDPEPAAPIARDELQFRTAGRLMKGNLWLGSKALENEREFEDIFPFFAYSIYRNGAFAFDRLGAPSSSNTALSETPSDVFDRSAFPLLRGMVENPALTNTASGLVRYSELYYGDINDATAAEKQATASFIGSLFAIDGRLELFSYFNPSADFMELFAAGMMKYKHDIHVEIAMLELSDNLCDRQVAYGVSNRVASTTVIPRLRYVMETILGASPDLNTFFDSDIGVAEELPIGVTWCDSAPQPSNDVTGFLTDELFGRAAYPVH